MKQHGKQLEIIILGEVRKRKANNTPLMWNLNYGTNEPIYKTETDSKDTENRLVVGEGATRVGDGLGV